MIVGLAGAVAQSDFAAQPFLIGAWIDHSSFTARQASLLAFCETLSLALTMFGVSPRMRSVSLSRLAVLASLLLIAAQVLSATIRQYVLLAACRCAAGFALGLFSAAANTAAARTTSPERAFAVSTGVMVLLFSGLSILLPVAGRDLGPKGMLCALAIMSAVCVPAWILLPRGRARSPIAASTAPRHHIPVGAATSVIATMLLFSTGAAAIFAFSERIGHSIGMSPNEIGTTSAIAYLLSLIGPIGVAGLGTRMGRTAPLLVGLIGTAASCVAVGEAWNSVSYGVAIAFNDAIWWFAYSYIMGMASTIDSEGTLVSIAGGTYLVGFSCGTALAGLVATATSYSAIGWAAAVTCASGVCVIWQTARKADLAARAAREVVVS